MRPDTWIYNTLKNDSQIAAVVGARVYRDVAPSTATYPLIVFQSIDMIPVDNAYRDNIMDAERWQVKLVDASSYTRIRPAAERIRSLLHKQAADGIVSCTYEMGMDQPEAKPDGAIIKSIIQDFVIHTK